MKWTTEMSGVSCSKSPSPISKLLYAMNDQIERCFLTHRVQYRSYSMQWTTESSRVLTGSHRVQYQSCSVKWTTKMNCFLTYRVQYHRLTESKLLYAMNDRIEWCFLTHRVQYQSCFMQWTTKAALWNGRSKRAVFANSPSPISKLLCAMNDQIEQCFLTRRVQYQSCSMQWRTESSGGSYSKLLSPISKLLCEMDDQNEWCFLTHRVQYQSCCMQWRTE